jgi:hypothetical protein
MSCKEALSGSAELQERPGVLDAVQRGSIASQPKMCLRR